MKIFFRNTVLLALALGTWACNLPTAGSNPSQASGADTPTAPPAANPCDNPLYPVKQGATWTYATTGGPTGPANYTSTISEVRPDGFIVSSQFGDVSLTQQWACKPEGLLALELSGAATAALSANGAQAQFTTTKSEGVTIPAQVAVGDEWTYHLEFQGKMDITGGQQADATGTADFHLKALGTESVSVPAGTFDAMKIQIDTTINLQVSTQGINVPMTLTDATTAWYAPGVGMIKSSDDVNVTFFAATITTELQSYSIP